MNNKAKVLVLVLLLILATEMGASAAATTDGFISGRVVATYGHNPMMPAGTPLNWNDVVNLIGQDNVSFKTYPCYSYDGESCTEATRFVMTTYDGGEKSVAIAWVYDDYPPVTLFD